MSVIEPPVSLLFSRGDEEPYQVDVKGWTYQQLYAFINALSSQCTVMTVHWENRYMVTVVSNGKRCYKTAR